MSVFSRGVPRAGLLLLAFCASLDAGETKSAVSQPRPIKSKPPPYESLHATKFDPELETILKEWEQASSQVHRLDCAFTRYTYDHTFEVERRGTGWCAMDTDGRAAYTLKAESFAPEKHRRRNKAGQPYELRAETPVRLHWTGTTVISVNESDRTFEIIDPLQAHSDDFLQSETVTDQTTILSESAAEEFQPDQPELPSDEILSSASMPPRGSPSSKHIVRPKMAPSVPTQQEHKHDEVSTIGQFVAGLVFAFALGEALSKLTPAALCEAQCQFRIPRVFLIGVRSDDLKQRFQIELTKKTDDEVWLKFRPLTPVDQRYFTRTTIILTRGEYNLRAVKTVDVVGQETVHVFTDVRTNGRGSFLPPTRLDQPDLQGYRSTSKGAPTAAGK